MKNDDVVPNTMSYNAVILAFSKKQDLDNMVKWSEEMKEKGLRPILETYAPIIRNLNFKLSN